MTFEGFYLPERNSQAIKVHGCVYLSNSNKFGMFTTRTREFRTVHAKILIKKKTDFETILARSLVEQKECFKEKNRGLESRDTIP